jgi:predicted dehydrogenase
MHRACVGRGFAVYLEKPPTLWWNELEEMIAADARAARATEVGFNFISEPARQALKARLLAGEFGALREAAFVGCWPRAENYFTRNDWAGRLFAPGSDVPLLDSCAGNAMGHYLQNLLFWAGPQPGEFAEVRKVRAGLYRANAIEGTDTVFAEAETPAGVVLRFGSTHACAPHEEGHAEYLVCENARLRYITDRDCEIAWKDGRREVIDLRAQGDWQERNFRRYFEYLAGRHAAPVVSLRDCRAFVAWYDLMFGASPGITTIGAEFLEMHKHGTLRAVKGLAAAVEKFAVAGRWPHEDKDLRWAREPGHAHLADLPLVWAKIRGLKTPQG